MSVTINYVVYTLNNVNNTASVIGRSSPPANWTLVIPSTITVSTVEYAVTSIGSEAFYNLPNLLSITIPNSVTSIGGSAFEDCTTLTSLVFEENSSLTTIGEIAFRNCSNLTGTLSIPNSVTSIGSGAFADCSKLTSLVFEADSSLNTIGNSAFRSCSNLTETLIIPNSVTSIGNRAFRNCSSLTSLVFEANSSLTRINQQAFYGCNKLEGTLTIPNSVTFIGEEAFVNCTSLTSLNLGSGVQELDNFCFRNIPFTSIYFQSPTTPLTTLGEELFKLPLSPLTVTYYYAPNGISDLNEQMVTLKDTYFGGATFIYLASCFAEGTKILCLENNEEKWVNVEDLKLNTMVKTYLHGYKAIKCMGESKIMNHPSDKSFRMYKMSKEEHSELMEDLILTADHSILVDTPTIAEKRAMKKLGFHETIDDKELVLASESSKFKKIMEMREYNVYNFALESETGEQRYGVYANGILCETPSMNSIKKKKHEFIEFWEE
jgi:hypothetical protein